MELAGLPLVLYKIQGVCFAIFIYYYNFAHLT